MLLAVAHLHGFNNMRMTADDEIDPLRDKPIGKGALRSNWLELIFNAPMQVHTDGMCTPLPCFSDIGRNEFLIDEIDHNIALNGDAVGAIGIVQKSDFHVLDGDDVRDDFVTLLLVTIGADVRNPHRIKRLASAHQSLVAAVQTMIVGCEEKIKPHVTQLLGIAVGSAEARITRVRLAAQRALQVNHSEVSPTDVILKVLKTGTVVIGAVGLLRCRDLRCMLHRITHEGQVHRVIALQQRYHREHQYG